MLDRSLTPSITVTIGRHTRLYFAFVTTAPAELDSPATITLLADSSAGTVLLRGGPFHPRHNPQPVRRAARARRCDGARVATRQIRGKQPPAARGGSRARRPQHAAALALATACRPPV